MTTEDKKAYFDAYPEAQVLHITSDGQVFLQANYSDGVNHQAHLNRGKSQLEKIETISRKEFEQVKEEKDDEEEEIEIPNNSWKKEDIVKWLIDHNDEGNMNERKEDLLARVQLVAEALADKLANGKEDETKKPE